MDISSPEYEQAFDACFRRGVAIPLSGELSGPLSVKQTHPTTHYIWRARQDGRTRPTHAANHGKIFAWDNPPPTGIRGKIMDAAALRWRICRDFLKVSTLP